jgi:hypothetical protein
MLSKQINNDNNNNWDKKKIKIVKGWLLAIARTKSWPRAS